MPANGVSAFAYPAGQRDALFAIASDTNPLGLAVRAGEAYDIVVRLEDDRSLTLSGQQVAEGDLLILKVAPQDFK
jgi:hypothetical protein